MVGLPIAYLREKMLLIGQVLGRTQDYTVAGMGIISPVVSLCDKLHMLSVSLRLTRPLPLGVVTSVVSLCDKLRIYSVSLRLTRPLPRAPLPPSRPRPPSFRLQVARMLSGMADAGLVVLGKSGKIRARFRVRGQPLSYLGL